MLAFRTEFWLRYKSWSLGLNLENKALEVGGLFYMLVLLTRSMIDNNKSHSLKYFYHQASPECNPDLSDTTDREMLNSANSTIQAEANLN